MQQINTEEFATEFYNMIDNILIHNFKKVGDWQWGDPAGLSDEVPVYEINSKYGTVWCSTIIWTDPYGYENRKGVLATFPVTKKPSLGQIVNIVIPYVFKRIYNTRAFYEKNDYEIRNYGKFTIGRASLKKETFFNYIAEVNHELIMIDEEGKKYINIFKYEDSLTPDLFAEQIVKFTLLIDRFKKQNKILK